MRNRTSGRDKEMLKRRERNRERKTERKTERERERENEMLIRRDRERC